MKINYIDKKTAIHRLHPACKILWVLGVLYGSIIINDPILLSILFLTTISFAYAGKIIKEWLSLIKLALYFSCVITLINLLASQHGQTILFSLNAIPLFGEIKITLESLVFGIAMSLRLLTTISSFAIITLTINPDDLMQTILRLKFPHKTAFITTLAIRFIPTLFIDLEKLQDSIKSRGYKLNEKSFIGRIKNKALIITPLLSNSLDRSIQSAEAMEVRGFGSTGKKTIFKVIKITNMDYFFIILSAILFLLFTAIRLLKLGIYDYYPHLTTINLNQTYILTVFLIIFFISAPAIFSPLKQVVDID